MVFWSGSLDLAHKFTAVSQAIGFVRPVVHKIVVLARIFPRTYGSENFGAVDYQRRHH